MSTQKTDQRGPGWRIRAGSGIIGRSVARTIRTIDRMVESVKLPELSKEEQPPERRFLSSIEPEPAESVPDHLVKSHAVDEGKATRPKKTKTV